MPEKEDSSSTSNCRQDIIPQQRRRRRTVVLIHINAPTFRPMATAPAVPPRSALFADLSKISLNVGWGFFSSALIVSSIVYAQTLCFCGFTLHLNKRAVVLYCTREKSDLYGARPHLAACSSCSSILVRLAWDVCSSLAKKC